MYNNICLQIYYFPLIEIIKIIKINKLCIFLNKFDREKSNTNFVIAFVSKHVSNYMFITFKDIVYNTFFFNKFDLRNSGLCLKTTKC